MHMADALISPAVGGTMWMGVVGLGAYCVKKTGSVAAGFRIPLMGVLGAFIFCAQMINFSIPATGSSGHLGGGLILAVLLGPYSGFLVMASILFIQALFFGDGGILSYGCNVLNLGFYTCFIAYPLIFKTLIAEKFNSKKIFFASVIAAIIGLQLGALSVVLQTEISGITDIPFKQFILLMQPIHLAIGVVEGLISAAVINFVWNVRPEILQNTFSIDNQKTISFKPVLLPLAVIALLTGVVLSWFASTYPDGLEWSVSRATGKEEVTANGKIHSFFTGIQEKTAFFPDYNFKRSESDNEEEQWPNINTGTSTAGFVGAALTFLFAGSIGFGIKLLKPAFSFKKTKN